MFLDDLTVEDVQKLFPAAARRNVQQNWPEIKKQLRAWGLQDREIVLYVLGTIRAENEKFRPGPEVSSTHSRTVDRAGYMGIHDPGSVRPFGAYDSTIRFKDGKPIVNKQLGNAYWPGKDENLMRARQGMPLRPDLNEGEFYRGRGYVQLTGKYNYTVMQRRVGKQLGVDLVAKPDDAGDPVIAAKILACFIAGHRTQIEEAMRERKFESARRSVNAQALHWKKLEHLVLEFEKLESEQQKKAAAEKATAPAATPPASKVRLSPLG